MSNNDSNNDNPDRVQGSTGNPDNNEDLAQILYALFGIVPDDAPRGSGTHVERSGRMHLRDLSSSEVDAARQALVEYDRQERAEIERIEREREERAEKMKMPITTENYELAVVNSLDTVNIDTPPFQTTAYGLYDLPAMQVMEALSLPENMKMQAFIKMLKLAILDQNKVDALDLLTFTELADVLSEWMERSAVAAAGKQEPKSKGGLKGLGH